MNAARRIRKHAMPTTHLRTAAAWHAALRRTAEPAALYCASRASGALLRGASACWAHRFQTQWDLFTITITN